MALPHHHLQLHSIQQQQQQQQSNSFRDIYNNMDGQISTPVAYFNGSNLPEQSQHPPYIPAFQVVGLAPGPADEGGLDLQWNYALEPKKRRLKEQDFLENNNSQISSVDFLQQRSVSTGLGLSLDNGRLGSCSDSAFLGLVGDDIERELQRQDADIDRYIKVQEDEYHRLANATIHDLLEKLEEYGDSVDIDGFDVDYGNEVLLKLGDLGTYVINKQTPNRQIWMSSPVRKKKL